MASSVRKSGRQRKPTRKADDDPFAGIELSDEERVRVRSDDDDSADEFVAPAEAEEPSEDDVLEGEDDIELEDDSPAVDDDFSDIDMTFDELATPRKTSDRPRKSRPGERPVPMSSTLRASRGLSDPRLRGSKEQIRLFMFGPAEADQQRALHNVYRWKLDAVLPSRHSKAGLGGYHRSYYEKETMRKQDMENDWKWYDDHGGKEAFQQHQEVTELGAAAGTAYLPGDSTPINLLLGEYDKQHLYKLPPLAALDLDKPFLADPDDDRPQSKRMAKRSGWIINIGERVQTIGWAPNQEGDTQYLALATLTIDSCLDQNVPSAFTPQVTPKKSAIQIWEFTKAEDGYFDPTTPPQLRQVICADFGDIRQLKWCHFPRKYEEENIAGKRLGLLAGVWADGHIRVIDVHLSAATSGTQYLHLDSVAFAAIPDGEVFSAVCWVSAHALIGSTSKGGMGLFSLPTSLGSSPATPLVSSILQSTYITAITTCYPSRPHILVSTSLSGYISMTDLSRVTTSTRINPSNTIFSPRARIARQVIEWHDWSQMVLTIDDNQTLQGLPLRRFFGYSGMVRYKSSVLSLAASECHPFIAGAQISGDVSTTNIMRRVFNSKEILSLGRWFQHTWRRTVSPQLKLPGNESLEATTNGSNESQGRDQTTMATDTKDRGMTRFVEGFKAETTLIFKLQVSKDPNALGLFTTIHEAQTAVTQVAWNPNLCCGGWIAAGTATGLLRVEDLGTS
ncbi:Hypothetical protein D9617_15g042030 [Elsinoe fawcettii]|nr:Hypothetical protein D9617_15g042030 [Elsinoe fawcettii]